jgi:hypothetical protein
MKMLDKNKNIEILIKIANQYAREGDFFPLADLVKKTQKILNVHRDELDPLVIKALNFYLKQ